MRAPAAGNELVFTTPVAITAGTTYVVSYHTDAGHYAITSNGLASAVTNPPLTALASGGVYAYGSANLFPSNSFNASNYWVDAVYGSSTAPTPPSAPTGVTATAGNGSAQVSWTAPSDNGGSGLTKYTVTPYIGSNAQTPITVTGNPPATSTTVTGLTNGTTYTFKVSATNATGTGPDSSASSAVTPNGPPTAPTGVTATAGNGSAQVSWTAPSDNGGSGLTKYTVTPYIGSNAQTPITVTGNPPATSTTVTGLTNGTTYTFKVSATNATATGTDSSASNAVTPNGPPTAPTGVTATAGNGSAQVSWTAPSNNGGSGLTKYTVTPYIGSNAQTPVTVTGNPPATSTTVTGLTNGTTYTFKVSATTALGTGPDSSASNAVVPSAPSVPGAPTGVTASAGNASATVTWAAPIDSGGSGLTTYTVTPYIGSNAQTPVTVTGTPLATSTRVSGLTNGTAYTFTVSATNATGTGPASSPSTAVTPAAAPTVTGVTPASGATGVAVSAAPTATFSQAVVPNTVTFTVKDSGGATIAGSVSFNAGNTVATFTPTNPLGSGSTYTMTVSGAQNSNGTPLASPFVWTFTTTGPQCPCSVWQNGTPTGATDATDTSAVNLGLQFRADSSGYVTGVRFYKYSDNTGSHTGSLWSSTGTLLASGTFSGESASGWQELVFTTPVAITAGTTYVVSYHTDAGHYAITSNGLASAVTNPPLTALASGGVYSYGSANLFPSNSFSGSNYWVDVVYTQTAGTTPPTVTSVTPASGATGAAVSAAPTATFSQAVVPNTVTFTVKDSGGTTIPGSVSFNAGNTVATFTPTSSLAASTTYTATVSGAQNASGQTMSNPFTWSFTTGAVSQCPCSIWQNGTPTGAVDASDTSAVNLGLQFRASTSGNVTGVRFYKYSDNTGSHTGSLWSSTGTLLASGTFSGESASGWQELVFTTPVAITAGTTYVVSYHTDAGHYAITSNGLASAVTNPPLTALASGGVYAYGSANLFPSNSFNASNYWVDAVYGP